MHLTIPEPDITLYEDGFEKHDQLSRKADGDRLSELLTKINEPLVVALNGPWGSGKSFFLKCWVGEHLKREGNSGLTLYFDAFANDYLDDPLIALTGAIKERLDEGTAGKKYWEKARAVAPALGRAAFRIAVAGATAGVVRRADEIGDAIANAASGELTNAADAFWKQEQGRRTAMQTFRQALTELAGETRLIIVIDELDRCRPDYALSLLEVIKHFFNVDNVHFILGVNLDALRNTVRARYGAGIDAAQYLQKFIQLTMVLRPAGRDPDSVVYLQQKAAKIGLPGALANILQEYCELPEIADRLTLRDVERILTRCALLPNDFGNNNNWPVADSVVTAIFLETLAPDLYRAFRNRETTEKEIKDFFGLPSAKDLNNQRFRREISYAINLYLADQPDPDAREQAQYAGFRWSFDKPYHAAISVALTHCLDSFTLSASG